MADPSAFDPKAVAERGEQIYTAKYQSDFEAHFRGEFVAIDVKTEQAFHARTAEQAYLLARQASPQGIFHLVKVGEPGAFRVSYSLNGDLDRFLR